MLGNLNFKKLLCLLIAILLILPTVASCDFSTLPDVTSSTTQAETDAESEDQEKHEEKTLALSVFLDNEGFVHDMDANTVFELLQKYKYDGKTLYELCNKNNSFFVSSVPMNYEIVEDKFSFKGQTLYNSESLTASGTNVFSTSVALEGLNLPFEIQFGDTVEQVIEKLKGEIEQFSGFVADAGTADTMTLFSDANEILKLIYTNEEGESYKLLYREKYKAELDDGTLIDVKRVVTVDFSLDNKLGNLEIAVETEYSLDDHEEVTSTGITCEEGFTYVETEADTNYEYVTDLPDGLDFKGYDINVLVPADMPQTGEFTSEASDFVSSVSYERDRAVERLLNLEINVLSTADYINTVHQKDHHAGLGEYQIIADKTTNKGIMIINNYYHNLNILDYINFDKEYWSQGFGEAVTFGENNKQYLATGGFLASLYRSMYATVYNKDLLARYDADVIYSLVMSGDWTLDAQLAIINQLTEAGATNDGYYGLVSGSWISMDAYLTAANVHIIKQNPSTYDWMYNEDELTYLKDVVAKVQAITTNGATYLFAAQQDLPTSTEIYVDFENGKAAMSTLLLSSLEMHGLNSNINYGIAPMPKYSSSQGSYCTYVQDMVTSVGVSSIIREEYLPAIGATLEALAYYGYNGLKYPYFMRISNTPDDYAVLDMMYDTVTTDFCGIMSSTMESIKLRDKLRPLLSSDQSIKNFMDLNKSAIIRALRTINVAANKLP